MQLFLLKTLSNWGFSKCFFSVTYCVTVEFFRPKWLCTDLRGFPGLFGFKGFGVRFVGRGGTEKDEEI